MASDPPLTPYERKLCIVLTFLWMPYYPTGSIVLISLDVVVIWGLATWNTTGESA